MRKLRGLSGASTVLLSTWACSVAVCAVAITPDPVSEALHDSQRSLAAPGASHVAVSSPLQQRRSTPLAEMMMCNSPMPSTDRFPPGWAPNVWQNLQHVCTVAGCGCFDGRIDCRALSVRFPRHFRRAMTEFCVNGCECLQVFTPSEEIEAILKIDALLGPNRPLTWGRAGPRLSGPDSPPGNLPSLGGSSPTPVLTRSQYPSYSMQCDGRRPPPADLPQGWNPALFDNLNQICVLAGCQCVRDQIVCGEPFLAVQTLRQRMGPLCSETCQCIDVVDLRPDVESDMIEQDAEVLARQEAARKNQQDLDQSPSWRQDSTAADAAADLSPRLKLPKRSHDANKVPAAGESTVEPAAQLNKRKSYQRYTLQCFGSRPQDSDFPPGWAPTDFLSMQHVCLFASYRCTYDGHFDCDDHHGSTPSLTTAMARPCWANCFCADITIREPRLGDPRTQPLREVLDKRSSSLVEVLDKRSSSMSYDYQCDGAPPRAQNVQGGWRLGAFRSMKTICNAAGCHCVNGRLDCSVAYAGFEGYHDTYAQKCSVACQCAPNFGQPANIAGDLAIEAGIAQKRQREAEAEARRRVLEAARAQYYREVASVPQGAEAGSRPAPAPGQVPGQRGHARDLASRSDLPATESAPLDDPTNAKVLSVRKRSSSIGPFLQCNGPPPPARALPFGLNPFRLGDLRTICTMSGCNCVRGQLDCSVALPSFALSHQVFSELCANACRCVSYYRQAQNTGDEIADEEALARRLTALAGENAPIQGAAAQRQAVQKRAQRGDLLSSPLVENRTALEASTTDVTTLSKSMTEKRSKKLEFALRCGPHQPPADLWPVGWEWEGMQDQSLVCEIAGCGCTGPGVACSRDNTGYPELYGAFARHCAGACHCEPQYMRMRNIENEIVAEHLRVEIEAVRLRKAELERYVERLWAEATRLAQAEDVGSSAPGPSEKRTVDGIAGLRPA